MPNTKVSGEAAASALDGTEILLGVQAGGNVKVLISAIVALARVGYAPLDSPALLNNPTAPTQTAGNNSTRLANTAFVRAEVAALVNSAPGTLDTLGEIAAALQADESTAAALATTVAAKLAKASNLSDLTNAAAARGNIGLDVIERQINNAAPTDRSYTIDSKAAIGYTINQLRGIATASGTCTVAVKINGTNVTGMSAISVTSTPQDVTASAANVVVAGDKVTYVVSGSSSPVDLEATLKATR